MLTFNISLAVLIGLFHTTFVAAVPVNSSHLHSRWGASIRAQFHNNCNFPVYVRQNVAAHPGVVGRLDYDCLGYSGADTSIVVVASRQVYTTPLQTYQDTCGHSIKVSRKRNGPVYQYEFNWARENGKIWYNLSHNDGNPFTDVARQIGGPLGSTCPYLRCDPGDWGSCDDPQMSVCNTVGDLVMYLC